MANFTEAQAEASKLESAKKEFTDGNFDDIDLTTTITIYFIAKEQLTTRATFKSVLFGSSGGSPVVRKIYQYRDCIPHSISGGEQAQYSSDTTIEMNTIIKRHDITNFVSLSKF